MDYKLVGLDKWELDEDLTSFLHRATRRGWTIYDVQVKDKIIFYASIVNRSDIASNYEDITLCHTTGLIGFFIRSLHRPARLISLVFIVIIWWGLSHVIFDISIKGEKAETKEKILDTLHSMDKEPPFYSDGDEKELKMELKKILENDIAWLEIVKTGSRYVIYYTPKEFANIEELNRNELIAQKDGVIAGFELQHGNKNFKIDDYIQKGDVLVSNVMLDSTNKPEELYVKGRVFAYTWSQVELTMEANKWPKAFQFYQLLFEARREVSKDFRDQDRIHKENILQFQEELGKIKIVVLYTLYEDITTPR